METKDERLTTQPIHDENYERAVLGTLLVSSNAVSEVREHLSANCFYNPKHQMVYEAIRNIDNEGGSVNFMTVNAELSKAGSNVSVDDLIDLMQSSMVGSVLDYALRLKELDIRRQLWELGHKLIKAGTTETDDVIDVQEEARNALTRIFSSTTVDVHTLSDAYGELQTQMTRNRQFGGETYGTPTGFREIDRRGGLAPTDLIVVAGETSMGKTSFATALAMNAIKAECPIAFYSMEMSNVQLAARIAAMESGINSRSILQDGLPDDKLSDVNRAMQALPMNLCYFDDDATASFDKIAASIRTLVLKRGIKGAVVDYIQILNVNMKSVNKEQAMGEVSRRLKNLAKELDIWIIILSQLNRDKDRPQPTLDRLRDSGQIGEAADSIMLIYRPSAKPGHLRYPAPYDGVSTQNTAFINVAKGRNTGIYSFICGFNGKTTCFYDLDQNALPMDAKIVPPPRNDGDDDDFEEMGFTETPRPTFDNSTYLPF